jgi:hypothetical protein
MMNHPFMAAIPRFFPIGACDSSGTPNAFLLCHSRGQDQSVSDALDDESLHLIKLRPLARIRPGGLER